MCSDRSNTPLGCWVSPFGHPRINAWSTAPRGFSQSPTSFIGSRRQGIHRWLFLAWKNIQRCSCSLCNSQGTRGDVVHQRRPEASTQMVRLPQNGREDAASEQEPFAGELNLYDERTTNEHASAPTGVCLEVTPAWWPTSREQTP